MPTSSSELDAFWQGAAPEGRQRYEDVKLIGQGAYSVVARATDVRTGEPVAIKRIAEVFYDAQEAKKVLREIRLLRDFHHPNVIELTALITPASMETFDDIFMVTSFMESDLRRIIKSRTPLEPGRVVSYMAQLLAGLHHVHAHAGIHRDLKPANILVSNSRTSPACPYGLLRLCDFGLARVDSNQASNKRELEAATQVDDEMDNGDADGEPASPPSLKKQMTSYVVTRWYRAPEVILRETYTSAIDLWAVGCIFKELLELQPASRFRTGAMFPGRYCIPFSFDDDQRERQRHDQLAVITRILGAPTATEMAWAGDAAREEILNVCPEGQLSTLSDDERKAQLDTKMAEACPIMGQADLALARSLLEFDPTARPNAKAALEFAYFDSLSADEKPVITAPPEQGYIESSHAFEEESLGSNELRILLANDLFRMHLEDTQSAVATS